MKIEIETGAPLTDQEKAILRVLLGESSLTNVINVNERYEPKTDEPEQVQESKPEEITVESVAKQAQVLITSGERDRVVKALEQIGAKRIRELTPEQAVELSGLLS